MYTIRYDVSARILHLRLVGFWHPATFARFTAELLIRATALKMRRIDYAVLSDSTEFPIQSPIVAQGFGHIMAKGAEMHRGPTAIIVAGQLNKMQAERTMKGDRLRVFLSETDARDWIAAEMTRRAA